jgi:transcriptional antiterminator RfaH
MNEWLDIPRWYIVQTKPKQEDRAYYNLSTSGIETFLPKIIKSIKNQFSGRSRHQLNPLFPQYIFAKFKVNEKLQQVRFTRGVRKIVSFGETLCPIDDDIITLIKERSQENDLINLEDEFKPGDPVIVTKPYLQDFVGVFEANLNHSQRVSILLCSIKYQVHLVVDKKYVMKRN